MARPEKVAAVEEIKDKMGKAKVVVLADFSGISVLKFSNLRRSLSKEGSECKVFKNKLIAIATKEEKLEGLAEVLSGSTALIFGFDDELAAPKLLMKFTKDIKELKIKGGIIGGKIIGPEGVKELAALPSFEELLAKLMGSMKSPISGFVNVASGPIRGFITALDAVAKQKA